MRSSLTQNTWNPNSSPPRKQVTPRPGWNMKASEMNAAFGLAQLDKLDRFKAMGFAGFFCAEGLRCWVWCCLGSGLRAAAALGAASPSLPFAPSQAFRTAPP